MACSTLPWRGRLGEQAIHISNADLPHRESTRLKLAEQAQRESEERFRNLIEGSIQGIVITRDGKLLFANQALADIWGYATVDDLLRVDSLWSLMVPHDQARLQDHYQACLAAGTQAILHDTWQGVHRQGHLISVEHKACLVTWQGGPAIQLSVIDITARKRAEQTLQRIQQRLWELAARLQERQENERRYIAREIHDELAQGLTGLKLDVFWLANHLADEPATQRERLTAMGAQLDWLMNAVRRIGASLRPEILDDLGLAAAIEWQLQEVGQRTGLTCRLTLPDDDVVVEPERATALFRIFQEALTNVVRHAEAHTVDVRLTHQNGAVSLEVHDDGKGIPAARLADCTSLGLLSMRERTQLWGGEVSISGSPKTGTSIRVCIPSSLAEQQGVSS